MVQSFQRDELRFKLGLLQHEGVNFVIHVEDVGEEETNQGRVGDGTAEHTETDAEHIDYVANIDQDHQKPP